MASTIPSRRTTKISITRIFTCNLNRKGNLHISSAEKKPTSFDQGTLDLLRAGKSGLQIAVVGIGGIRPISPSATLAEVQLLPAPMPLYLNLTESILAIMMDTAGRDPR
ncbi:hypothetical protein Pst134EA_020878 [Puccinia striiformis f. sp. tritici]|uniref:hypothetical protein n=1 Tax=Puccinia striiformis f. sp. tritici TaxID=168172 RepID=UPI002007EE43|nr:hypothetical protein Pst134EA_020878 [Puccinia striiformis f. sp. tritici]KAH9456972.1 hypothetical protein Pst134EA_020878 [Puccinia striiformis f. sp. tritici]